MPLAPQEIVIFVGPSLPRADAQKILAADYRPPIRRGDISALLPTPPKIVGIIDGKFFQSFAISPKEILPALEAGIVVLGASSMGALRAVELAPFGMIGVGRIFELFHSGELDADDEVAMIFDESDGRPQSVPLVNVRLALSGAVEKGLIGHESQATLLRHMKALYFPERSQARLLRLASEHLPAAESAALRSYLESEAPDAKREDAVALLRRAKQIADGLG